MVKRPLLFIILLGIASIATTQQSWEGLATVSRFGRFPAGLYGASNLVLPNSLVSVRNLETGLSERIIITDGVDEPGVFLVLSPEAAVLLNVSGSGATRVRLTAIVTDRMPVDTASEQPFHRDPDINPAAGVTAYPEIPTIEDGIVAAPAADEPEAAAIVEAAGPIAEETADVPTEDLVEVAVVEAEMAVAQTDEPTVAPSSTGRRSGIAAGVARTRVGQAQESFERPETPLEIGRPGPIDETTTVVGEPEVEPEETATAGIAALVPRDETVPVVAAQPELPSGGEPVTDETPVAVVPPDAAEDVVLAEGPELANPINDAVAAAVNRIPARDFFPPPVGEDGDLGFAGLARPADNGRLDVALAEADVPPVDRPELAGLAPLRAVPANLPASLAEAAVPPEDLPEFAALGIPTPPSERIGSPLLPMAQVGAEERPVVEDLSRYSAPGVALTPGTLAEAAVAPPETPSSDGVTMVSAPVEPLDAVLLEAGVAEMERPELADIGRADAPTGHALDATLAEAGPYAEERPDDSLVALEPSPAGEVPAVTFEPDPGDAEVSVAEGSIESPADKPTDVLLTLEPADFRPPDVPKPDEESLIDRETPVEEPVFVAVLETPEAATPRVDEVADAVETVETVEPVQIEEPIEVAAVAVDRVVAATARLPVVSDLVDNNYYLQIGAYTVPATAQVAVDALSATYPMAVLPIDSRGTTVYRVLVGPLEQDETGTLLMWLRAKGYRDTFIRSGAEL
jgi:hypothetical protein